MRAVSIYCYIALTLLKAWYINTNCQIMPDVIRIFYILALLSVALVGGSVGQIT